MERLFYSLFNLVFFFVITQVESTHATRTSEKKDREGQEQKPEVDAQSPEIDAKGNSDESGDCDGDNSAGTSSEAGTATGNGEDKGPENRVETGAHEGDGDDVNSGEAKDASKEKRRGTAAGKGADTTSVAVSDTTVGKAAPTTTTKSEGPRNGSGAQGREDSKSNAAEEDNRGLKMVQRRRKSTGSDGRKPEPQRAVGYPMTAVSAVLRQLHRRVLTDEEMAMLDKVGGYIDAAHWNCVCFYILLYFSVKSRGERPGGFCFWKDG